MPFVLEVGSSFHLDLACFMLQLRFIFGGLVVFYLSAGAWQIEGELRDQLTIEEQERVASISTSGVPSIQGTACNGRKSVRSLESQAMNSIGILEQVWFDIS